MFGDPVLTSDGDAIFHLVWTYNIKAVDGQKKASCVCDGSTRSGKVLVLLKPMQTASNRQALDFSMLSPPQISSLSSVPMYPTPLQRHPHPNNLSLFDPTGHSMIGGSTISTETPSQKNT